MLVDVDMIRTLALAPFVLLAGSVLKKKLSVLDRLCLPTPVIGGVLFSAVFLVLRGCGVSFTFDKTLSDVAMLVFFTSVGYKASFRALHRGGRQIAVFLVIVVFLVLLQNILSLGLGQMLGVDPLLALCTGSISMIGGHGTAAAFGPTIEKMGFSGASTIALAAATFGMACGSMIGSPLGKTLIRKKNLAETAGAEKNNSSGEAAGKNFHPKTAQTSGSGTMPAAEDAKQLLYAGCRIVLAMGIGAFLSDIMSLTGLTFPAYLGSMIAAAAIRNAADISEHLRPERKTAETPASTAAAAPAAYISGKKIDDIGEAALSLFLAVALMTMELWQLTDLAMPMLVILAAQTLMMVFFAGFIVFRLLGKDYDAAVMTAGVCGFAMGAIPNAIANMEALTEKFRPSPKAFLIVPLVGSLFIDLANSVIISLFISVL